MDRALPGVGPSRLGYRVLIALPGGIGFLLMSVAFVVPPKPAGGVLFGLGALCHFFAFLYFVATVFVKDRWYPRWYHSGRAAYRERG